MHGLYRRFACGLLLALTVACTAENTAQDERAHGPATPAAPVATGLSGAPALAERLVAGLRVGPEPGSRFVTIDDNVLRELQGAAEDRADIEPLRDPLSAARAFGPALGIGDGASYRLSSHATGISTGAGVFLATVQVQDGPRRLILRLTSEPDASEQPTLWLVNDYYQER